MENNLVVKRNEIINASYRLSVVEQRILLTAISKIPKEVKISDDELYTVSVEDLKSLGVHEKTAYRDLKEGVNRLYERSINFITSEGDEHNETGSKIRWVQEMHYTAETGTVSFRFSKPILPYISNVKSNFTQYTMSEISHMQSAYSVRIYELCKQYLKIGHRKIAIDDLKALLDLGSKYKTTGHLMDKVVGKSVKEINKLTTLNVKAEPLRTGRKYTHINFIISEKNKKNNSTEQNRDENTIDWVNNATDNELKITRPLTKKQADGFAGLITKYCAKDGNGTLEERNLGDTLSTSFLSWFDAKEYINLELQNEKTYRKYIPILLKVGYK